MEPRGEGTHNQIAARVGPGRCIRDADGGSLTPSDEMGSQLPVVVRAAAKEAWSGPSTDHLMQQIERRIVDKLPARLLLGLGRDEARQTARVLAWERLREWLHDPRTDLDRIGWGYLSNFVRWRVSDALDKQTLRWSRHVPTEILPEAGPYVPPVGDPAERDWDHRLGAYLDTIVAELVNVGMDRAAAAEAVHVACDDSDLRRSRVVDRLEAHVGIDQDAAHALADLLVGNAAARVRPMVRRLASTESRRLVVADPQVSLRLERIAAAAPPGGSRPNRPTNVVPAEADRRDPGMGLAG